MPRTDPIPDLPIEDYPEYYEDSANDPDAKNPGAVFGVYHVKEGWWVGNGADAKFPVTFLDDDSKLPSGFFRARLSAEVSSTQMGWPATTLRARRLPDGPWEKKGVEDARMSALEAIQLRESGKII